MIGVRARWMARRIHPAEILQTETPKAYAHGGRCRAHTSAARPEQFPAESLPEIAFLGRSNVGKSSLLNCLTGKKGLAFTSSKPGCTQLINFYRIDGEVALRGSAGIWICPGAVGSKARWKNLIESYLLERNTLRAAVVLLDARRGWMEQDLELKELAGVISPCRFWW